MPTYTSGPAPSSTTTSTALPIPCAVIDGTKSPEGNVLAFVDDGAGGVEPPAWVVDHTEDAALEFIEEMGRRSPTAKENWVLCKAKHDDLMEYYTSAKANAAADEVPFYDTPPVSAAHLFRATESTDAFDAVWEKIRREDAAFCARMNDADAEEPPARDYWADERKPSQLKAFDVKNDPNTVLGERWLCKGKPLMIVSQSGIGKSSLLMQLVCGWALGRTDMTFGIKPIKPLKQLVIQAENDEGDVAEAYQAIVSAYEMTADDEMEMEDMWTTTNVLTPSLDEFFEELHRKIENERPDICWIDPLYSFIDDLVKPEVTRPFMHRLNQIMAETGVIFAFIHHTGKPKETPRNGTATDLAYSGLGDSMITTNWPREIVSINRVPTPDDVPATFKMTCTKRGLRAGMRTMLQDGDAGETRKTEEIYICHGEDGKIYWRQCPEPPKAKKEKPRGSTDRPPSLSAPQMAEVVETAAKHGGRLPLNERQRLAAKFSKSPKTIQRALSRLEENAALSGQSVEEALESARKKSPHDFYRVLKAGGATEAEPWNREKFMEAMGRNGYKESRFGQEVALAVDAGHAEARGKNQKSGESEMRRPHFYWPGKVANELEMNEYANLKTRRNETAAAAKLSKQGSGK